MSNSSGSPGGDLYFLFGIHNHQPVGNLDQVIGEACRQAYHPFLTVLRQFPQIVLTVHTSGSLLEWLKEQAPATFDLLGELAHRGQIELLTGAFYEPILSVLPDWDKIGQIQRLSEFLVRHFGVRPRGMWLAERVWEPHLPRSLREAGVEYVLVDDSHFDLAGLAPAGLDGYYLTDEQGAIVAVFPINMRLRYLIPFAEPARTLQFLADRRARVRGITLVDDGEKFGVWPGTHRLVYDNGWLAGFFETLAGADWLRLTTFSRYLDQFPPTGRVYLPAAAYREMGEWALPAEAGEELTAIRDQLSSLPEGDRLAAWLRGGFWRNFLVKYPEAGDAYWKMLHLSQALQRALASRPEDPRLAAARLQLWRGQANDAYWHGVFGGLYLPHLRRATKKALITADRLLGEARGDVAPEWSRADINGDGRVEVTVRTSTLSLTLNPEAGGSVTELAYLPKGLDLADVLTRRREAYHARVKSAERIPSPGQVQTIHDLISAKEPGLDALLSYDRFRRASLLDGLFDEEGLLEPVHPWEHARLTLGDLKLASSVSGSRERVTVSFWCDAPHGYPLEIHKEISVPSGGSLLEVGYRLRWMGGEPLVARWGVQWNLALTAGEAPGRYLRLPERSSLGSGGSADGRRTLSLVDEWIEMEIRLGWGHATPVAWAPVETVSTSEAGFERIYQGLAILLCWPLHLSPGRQWQEKITLSILDLARGAR